TNTATYGQTITATASQSRLSSFSFELSQASGTAPQYQAFVYQWNPGTQRISGPALYSSGVFTAPTGAAYTPVSFNTGNIVLTPGQQYVMFLSTSNQQPQANSAYRYGATPDTAYAGGRFVFNNNGANFASLSSTNWSNISIDLAFTAFLTGGNDGENHTQAQHGAFQLGNSYLSLLTDPFSTNRVGTTGPMGYAAEKKVPAAVAAANAMVTKAPPIIYSPRWDVWGAAFGGSSNARGEFVATPAIGTSAVDTRVYGIAAGADYRYAPDSLIGFSLAGGNINWSLSGAGLGSGSSDAFMAGIYGRHTHGPAYVSGALTYTNYWMRTDRVAAIGLPDQLRADFNAESWGGRLEAGYRVPGNWLAIQWTPYGAIQGQSFHTPGYGEVAVVGSNAFALNFAARTATAVRGEVGLRTDKVFAIDKGSQFNVFGKVAYAHDEVSDPNLSANFTTLGAGGTPFTVFGTRPSRDLLLSTSGAEWRLANGISIMAKFDSEYGERTRTYYGTGRLRYTW
ncbi:MAG: Type Va secretion system autotransporter protein, partial [Bradyrhizobium sp.]|nr:Type Va secretion system autotransporter protein [Bradyrhizobium sp.]